MSILPVLSPFHTTLKIDDCVTEKDLNLDISSYQIIALIIVSLFMFTSIISTIYEFLADSQNTAEDQLIAKIMLCFSAKKNTEMLFDLSESNIIHSHNFKFINGLKVISIIWVIVGHTYMLGALLFMKDIPTANFYRKFSTHSTVLFDYL